MTFAIGVVGAKPRSALRVDRQLTLSGLLRLSTVLALGMGAGSGWADGARSEGQTGILALLPEITASENALAPDLSNCTEDGSCQPGSPIEASGRRVTAGLQAPAVQPPGAASLHCVGMPLEVPPPRPTPLRVAADSFQPILVERIEPKMSEAPDQTAAATGEAGLLGALADLDPATLRVLSTMSPEQIDALTIMFMTRNGAGTQATSSNTQDPAMPGLVDASGRLVAGSLPEEAPWVGEWSDDDIAADAAASVSASATPDAADGPVDGGQQLTDWELVEYRDGHIEIVQKGGQLTEIALEPGMVLDRHGRVEDIVRGPDELLVFLASGAMIRGAANPDVGFRPAARPGALKAQQLLVAARQSRTTKALRLGNPVAAPVPFAPPVPVDPPYREATLTGPTTENTAPLVEANAQLPEPIMLDTMVASTKTPDRAAGAPRPRPPAGGPVIVGPVDDTTALDLIVAPRLPAGEPAAARQTETVKRIEVGVFASEAVATRVSQQLLDFEMIPVVATTKIGGRTYFKVLVDAERTPSPPERVFAKLNDLGFAGTRWEDPVSE